MRTTRRDVHIRTLLSLALAAAAVSTVHAGEFVYQGRLDDRGVPAHGRYDLRIAAFADAKSAAGLIAPITFPGIEVRAGRFELRFDAPLSASAEAWLEVAVRESGDGVFSALPGRNKAISAPLIGTCWSSNGDSGSDPMIHFLGTTDAQPLVIRTGNAQSLRIEPSTPQFGGSPITANMIGGSSANSVPGSVRGATIAGGGLPVGDSDPDLGLEGPNRVLDHFGTVSGGFANQAGNQGGGVNDKVFATVGGGTVNVASGDASTVSGGSSNTADGDYSTVGGGKSNSADGDHSTVAGGDVNDVNGNHGTIGGGSYNFVGDDTGTVAGGYHNFATGKHSAIGGGYGNTASGLSSTVGGGAYNCAGGMYSWAGGYGAVVRPGSNSGIPGDGCFGVTPIGTDGDAGSFVWAGAYVGGQFASTGAGQFLVRASGGMALNSPPPNHEVELTITPVSTHLDYANIWLKQHGLSNRGILFSAGNGSGANDAEFYIDHYNGSTQYRRMELLNTGVVTIRSNITAGPSGVTMAAGSGAWSSLSDRNAKTAIEAIDPRAILERLLATPVSTWRYTAQDPAIRHIGPMAQDFAAQFAVGENDTTISTIDADGVALAAIQGLNAKLEAALAALVAENAAMRSELAALQRHLEADQER